MIAFSKKTYKQLVMLVIWLMSVSVYAQTVSREVAYLHTDRTVYVAGETIFYKLYLLDTGTQKRSDISKVGYIVIRAAGQFPAIKCRVKLDSGISNGSILLPDTLASGVYQLVAFTSSMKNYDEQLFSKNEIVVINSFDKDFNFKFSYTDNKILSDTIDKPISINTNKKIYSPREKVGIRINKAGIKANLSVSVFEDPGIPSSDNSIVEQMNKIKENQRTNGLILNKYLPENKYRILRARVFDSTTQQNISGATVLLSCIDTVPNLQYAKTNSSGVLQLLLSEYYKGKELFLTIRDMPANQNWKIEVEDEFALSENWNPTFNYDISPYKDFLIKSQHIAYIHQTYQTNTESAFVKSPESNPVVPRLYYCPVKPVLLSDYTPLNDFKEIILELFPQVKISRENGKYRVSVINDSKKIFSNSSIAIFMDGVYVDDLNKIMKLGSEQIKKIEVLDTERILGNLVYNGAISIITKSTEIEKTIPSSYSLRVKNNIFSNSDNYTVEKPDSIYDKTIPFFRQLLYWNPNLELKENENTYIDFFTSDNEGTFLLKFEGITGDGRPISYSSKIQVINHPPSAEK